MTRTRLTLFVTLALATGLLASFVLPRLTRAQGGAAMSPAALAEQLGTAFTYQGYLEEAGKPANGSYNMHFYLWDDSQKTNLKATYPKNGTQAVTVNEGLFTTSLDFGEQAFSGQERWLEVEVNGVSLAPLQRITPAPYALSLRPGAEVSGAVSPPEGTLNLSNSAGDGLVVDHAADDGVQVCATGAEQSCDTWDTYHNGIEIGSTEHHGILVDDAGWDGMAIGSAGKSGVYVGGAHDAYYVDSAVNGLYVRSVISDGVQIDSAGVDGVQVASAGGDGLNICTTGTETSCDTRDDLHNGIEIGSTEHIGIYLHDTGYSAIWLDNAGGDGVFMNHVDGDGINIGGTGGYGFSVFNAGQVGYFVGSAGEYGVWVGSAGEDGVFVGSATGDYIQAGFDWDPKFKVLNDGNVRADGNFASPANDFAELMALEGEPANYEPGDVLVVSAAQDRAVALSSEAYASAVIGVYSMEPGFVGGQPVKDSDLSGMAPVAVLGVVPTKVSAENGPIQRGDLLVTAATPGHAMRADAPPPGTVLGKALEALETGTGVILVMVMPQ